MISSASFIPDTIPDETVYSICSLYHQLSGSPSWSATNTYLFGENNNRPIALIPLRLGYFASRFAELFHDSQDVIDHHTIFPYFRAFMVDQMSEHLVLEGIRHDRSEKIKKRVSWGSSHIPENSVLRHCEACRQEQITRHRRSAWLRSHQLPGVYVCHKHALPLIESTIPIRSTYKKDGARFELPGPVDERPVHHMGHQDHIWQQSALLIAQLSHDLLSLNEPSIDPQFRSETYRRRLAEMGYGSRGQLDYLKTIDGMKRFYGERFLHYCHIFERDENRNWAFLRIFHNTRPAHPLFHLALIGFAFGSLDSYRESLDKVITSGWRKGEFARPKYARSGAKYRYIHIETKPSFSDEPNNSWEAIPEQLKRIFSEERSSNTKRKNKRLNTAIVNAYASGKSRSEIAQVFRIHRNTVKNHLAESPNSTVFDGESYFLSKRDECRQQINEALSSMDGASRTEIRKKTRNSYNWLYKRDKEWLFQNLPADRKKQRIQVPSTA